MSRPSPFSTQFPDDASHADAPRRGCAVVDRSDYGVLDVTGPDRVSLLQRITSNELDGVTAGQCQRNCFTSAKGRVIDWSRLLVRDDAVRVITSPGRVGDVSAWLDKYTIIEDLTVADRSGERAHLWLIGPDALSIAAKIAGQGAPDAGRFVAGQLGGATVDVIAAEPILDQPSYWITLQSDAAQAGLDALLGLGDVTPIGGAVADALRIESGLPAVGVDVTEERNPLEVGLWGSVSFDKGCYVGQEVLARLRNYDKVMNQLALLSLDGDASPGDEITADGKKVGALSSVATPPLANKRVALGLVKRRVLQTGEELRVGDGAVGATVDRVIRID